MKSSRKLDENEEELKRKVEEQAKKYSDQTDRILFDEEAGNNIWYRNKHQSTFKPKAKMDQAIENQLIKLMKYKEDNSK